jgi:hypothetical protein
MTLNYDMDVRDSCTWGGGSNSHMSGSSGSIDLTHIVGTITPTLTANSATVGATN